MSFVSVSANTLANLGGAASVLLSPLLYFGYWGLGYTWMASFKKYGGRRRHGGGPPLHYEDHHFEFDHHGGKGGPYGHGLSGWRRSDKFSKSGSDRSFEYGGKAGPSDRGSHSSGWLRSEGRPSEALESSVENSLKYWNFENGENPDLYNLGSQSGGRLNNNLESQSGGRLNKVGSQSGGRLNKVSKTFERGDETGRGISNHGQRLRKPRASFSKRKAVADGNDQINDFRNNRSNSKGKASSKNKRPILNIRR